MSTAITSWLPRIQPQVPGCPNPVIKKYLIDVLRDFCEETQLWENNELTAISLVADQADYALSSLSGDIVAIDSAEIDEVPIKPITLFELNSQFHNWRHTTTRRPLNYLQTASSSNITLVYTPSEALTDGLVVWVSLKPLETATTVEDFLWKEYRDAIANGTVGMLKMVDGMPWSDMQSGMIKYATYEAVRDTAKAKKIRGNTNQTNMVPHEWVC